MEYHLRLPIPKDDLKKLKVNDVVYLTGVLFTARDSAHAKLQMMSPNDLPFDPARMAMYHCGPLMKQVNGKWVAVSAGPTTSSRFEAVEDVILDRFAVHVIIGKGGMGERTRKALERTGSVYLAFPGGAGVLAAEKIVSVPEVFWFKELGMTEAVWILQVEEFGPLVVAMDSMGRSLYERP
jgi:tartrate/fumarate subfamily iron-sulfur-dependent hydro-lyase beta chain